jgi:hypothetical protein
MEVLFGRDAVHTYAMLAGLGLLCYGLWEIYQPLSFITSGALIVTGVVYARTRTYAQPD